MFPNRLLQLMLYSFYEKLARGGIEQSVFKLQREKETLNPKEVAVPHYAALTNTLVRTALSAIINCLHTLGRTVLQATMNGFTVALPRPIKFTPQFHIEKGK